MMGQLRSSILLPPLIILAYLSWVECLSCFCEVADCAAPTGCQYGIEKDACACCDVCIGGPGEFCGGPFEVSGNCGEGLYCDKGVPEHDFNHFQEFGVCLNIAEKPICDCPVFCIDEPFESETDIERDACDCCNVNKKGFGDKCGGPSNKYGSCGLGLVCDKSPILTNETMHKVAEGKCIGIPILFPSNS